MPRYQLAQYILHDLDAYRESRQRVSNFVNNLRLTQDDYDRYNWIEYDTEYVNGDEGDDLLVKEIKHIDKERTIDALCDDIIDIDRAIDANLEEVYTAIECAAEEAINQIQEELNTLL